MAVRGFLQLRWLGRERVTAYSAILAFASAASLFWMFGAAMAPGGSDFIAFWSAARAVLEGQGAAVYDPMALRPIQAQVGHPGVAPFLNPPPLLLAIWPLGLLPYPVAWLAWVGATYVLWFAATRRLARDLAWPIAAYPAALLSAWHAQTGFLTGTIQALVAGWLRDRPFRAGLCIGALVIKPHLALLFPVALFAARSWRAIGGAALSALALLALAWAMLGTDTMLAYPRSLALAGRVMEQGSAVFYLRQVTVYAAVRIFAPDLIANAAQALATLAMIAATWRVWAGRGSVEGKLAFLFAATPLATPYLFAYDLPFLVIPFLWLVRHQTGAWSRPVLVLLYLSPLVARGLALPLGFNPMVLVSAATVVMVWRCLRHFRASESAC